jgi:hypothetical protein
MEREKNSRAYGLRFLIFVIMYIDPPELPPATEPVSTAGNCQVDVVFAPSLAKGAAVVVTLAGG